MRLLERLRDALRGYSDADLAEAERKIGEGFAILSGAEMRAWSATKRERGVAAVSVADDR